MRSKIITMLLAGIALGSTVTFCAASGTKASFPIRWKTVPPYFSTTSKPGGERSGISYTTDAGRAENTFAKSVGETLSPSKEKLLVRMDLDRNAEIAYLSSPGANENCSADLAFECLTSILGQAPLDKTLYDNYCTPAQKRDGIYVSHLLSITPSKQQSRLSTLLLRERNKFSHDHPEIVANGFLLNTLPVGINTKYPGVLSQKELCSNTNYRVVPKSIGSTFNTLANHSELREFYKDWQVFFAEHPKMTKSALFEQRDRLVKNHSALFLNM